MKTRRFWKCVLVICLVIMFTVTPLFSSYASAAEAVGQITGTQNNNTTITTTYVYVVENEKGESVKKFSWCNGRIQVIAVLSDKDAIPDDAEFVVNAIDKDSSEYDYDAYMEALNAGSDVNYDESNTLLFDVAFIKDGVELQPSSGTVSVTFRFLNNQLSKLIGDNDVTDFSVVHLSLSDEIRDDYDKTADATDIGAGNVEVEKLTADENNLCVDVTGGTVKFETTGFSVFAYTVDFEYTDPVTGKIYRYNLYGSGSISLKDLAVILGITTADDADEFISGVENVEFSDETLVRVLYTSENGWTLQSLMPFSSIEQLTITKKDGTVIEIKVTDVQESDDLVDFLDNVVIVGGCPTSRLSSGSKRKSATKPLPAIR